MAKRSLETQLEEAQRGLARLAQEQRELSAALQDEQRQKEQLKGAKSELEEQKRLLDRTTAKLNKEVGVRRVPALPLAPPRTPHPLRPVGQPLAEPRGGDLRGAVAGLGGGIRHVGCGSGLGPSLP